MRLVEGSSIPHLVASLVVKHPSQSGRLLRLKTTRWRTLQLLPRSRCLNPPSGATQSFATRSFPEGSRRSHPSRSQQRHGEQNLEEENDGLRAGMRRRKIGPYFWGCCIFGFSVAMYGSYYYATYSKALGIAAHLDLPQNADVSDRWKDRTRNFDEEVDVSEKFMFLRAKRKRLINQASGNVLEVSCGTGRNMDLYDLRPYDPRETEEYGRSRKTLITSITFNDQSEVMVEQAERKFDEMEAKRQKQQRFNGRVNFIVGDAGIKGVIRRPEGGYDTIVQTMGVCSMVDAPGFLRRLGEMCRQPGEKSKWLPLEAEDGKGGKILLLEHGRGNLGFVNRILDNGAKMHANHYGCWWNKDVAEVVKQSGLEVEKIKRYNFGTTYEYVLRPRQKEV